MPEPVRDLLLDLDEDVRRVHLAPAEAVRARGRTRARRRVALAAAGLTLVAAIGGTSLVRLTGTPPSQPAAPPPPAASGSCPGLDLSLPGGPEETAVRVVDGAAGEVDAIGGFIDSVVSDLRNRGFTRAVAADDVPPGEVRADAMATLRYGPRAVGDVVVLQAMLQNQADTQFDPARTDAVVDLVMGKGFRQFATPTEMNQALVQAGEPTAPPECR